MRMLDLFSGIGGFALAAKWVWEDELDIVGFCEIEKYAQKVLQKNFPGVPIYEDITKLNGKSFKNIDIITGGFPCQDISIAGKGEGIEGSRSGLWTEMCRIISEVRPRYAIIENVPMLIHRGLERVLCDLAEIGYDCEWQIIGADDVGAWHRRKRIWIVAYPRCNGRRNLQQRSIRRNSTRELAQKIDRNTKTVKTPRPSATSEVVSKDVPDTEHNGPSPTDGQREKIESSKQTRKKSIGEFEGRSDLQDVSNPDRTGDRASTRRIDGDRQEEDERRKGQSQFKPGGYGEDVPDPKSKRGKRRKVREQRLDSQRKAGLSGRNSTRTTDVPDPNKQRLERHRGECELGESGEEVKVSRGGNVPDPDRTRCKDRTKEHRREQTSEREGVGRVGRCDTVPDTDGSRFKREGELSKPTAQEGISRSCYNGGTGFWSVEPNVGRVAHGIPKRVDRLKQLGNSVVPQIPYLLGCAILSTETLDAKEDTNAHNNN